MVAQIYWAGGLCLYAGVLLFLTNLSYKLMINKGLEQGVSVYYNRKILHIFVGGAIAIAVPFIFTDPIYPLFMALALAIVTTIPYLQNKRLYWVQTKENCNDVKFCVMAGLSIYLLWVLLDDPYLAIIPVAFMAFGDGITGIARNIVFKRRTKSAIGNVFMLIVSLPLGWWLASSASTPLPWWGVIAAVTASWIERYEFGPVDDNILITVASTLIILLGSYVGPL